MKHLRSFLRGVYYLLFRPNKGFVKEEKQLIEQYYSDESSLANMSETTVILMIDGRSVHGGLTDRLRGITTVYQYCKRNGIRFKLKYNYPFQMSDYLEPAVYDWRIAENEICYNRSQAAVLVLNDYMLDVRLHKYYLKNFIHKNRGKQIHVYSNTYFLDKYFSQSFRELFRPSLPLRKAIDLNLAHIGKKYVAMVFRFQQLLGDFKEDGYQVLEKQEQNILMSKCIEKVKELRASHHPDDIVLVTSDSQKFLNEIVSQLDFVRIIPGKVVHMDHTSGAAFDTYMKSFVDLFLLSKASKIYLLQTGKMYHSGFAKRASMINDVTYEEIIF